MPNRELPVNTHCSECGGRIGDDMQSSRRKICGKKVCKEAQNKRYQDNLGTCQWFALCDRPAKNRMMHPILGRVPICRRCRYKIERIQSATR